MIYEKVKSERGSSIYQKEQVIKPSTKIDELLFKTGENF